MQISMKNMQNKMQNNSETSIFGIFCILQYPEYSKYVNLYDLICKLICKICKIICKIIVTPSGILTLSISLVKMVFTRIYEYIQVYEVYTCIS